VVYYFALRGPAVPVTWYTTDAIPTSGSLPGQTLTEAGRMIGMTYVAVEAQVPAKLLNPQMSRLMESYEQFDSNEPGGGSLGETFRLDAPDASHAPMLVRLSLRRADSKGALKVSCFYLTSQKNAESGRLQFYFAAQRPVRLTSGMRRTGGR
jgi:hypothetical protein